MEINPVNAGVRPKPYLPSADDRRRYFFPNQPDAPGSRGVASVAEGLYNVDDYKTMGLDPILQAGPSAWDTSMSTANPGATDFRPAAIYVPQGLGLDGISWFTEKDLVHIQSIDAAADDGVLAYLDHPKVRLELAVVTGSGAPFHDYAYFDFTYGEDKNSAVATVARATYRPARGRDRGGLGAAQLRQQPRRRRHDAPVVQALRQRPHGIRAMAQSQYLTVYGEAVRYKWGLERHVGRHPAGAAQRDAARQGGLLRRRRS